MKERNVGVRKLKANLSACLRHVKSGETIVINERGKPIGRIYPIEMSLEERLHEGVKSRHWSWNEDESGSHRRPKSRFGARFWSRIYCSKIHMICIWIPAPS